MLLIKMIYGSKSRLIYHIKHLFPTRAGLTYDLRVCSDRLIIMLYGTKRETYRQIFLDSWRAYQECRPLEGVQTRIVSVILRHPEYHALLTDVERGLEQDFLPEQGRSNPYMHMSLHVGLEEMLALGEPAGIVDLFDSARRKLGETDAEHLFVDCLGEMMWQAQRAGRAPDLTALLPCVRRSLGLPEKAG
jgi:hypothetical protein